MELAYRLAVDESAYIKSIRDNVITLITPVVEVDGRDRMVDIYRWHRENPTKQWPPLIYWGHYVAHDNNRDSMGLTLQLTRNVLNTFVGFKAQVLHDLHESVPYLYDNTVGDGPYNAWIDPILADEWQMMGWNNVSEMTKLGMPGVFTHGTFDTWSPSYLMFIAAMHNGISRLYETFGNGGADTEERTLRPNEYARTWFKQNPPLPKTKWSQRNNNNYEQTGVLTALHYFAGNNKLFLRNFYLKAKRSIEKPRTEGPAAYVFPADDPRPGAQADLLRMFQDQGCEISRATAPFTVMMPAKKAPARGGRGGRGGSTDAADASADAAPAKPAEKPKPEPRTFPAGSYILRMDQPYSRIADSLLDYQYWAASDPQKSIYDDTGWTFGELGNVQVSRVTDLKVLDAAMDRLPGPVQAPGGVQSTGEIFLINHNADNALITLRYRFPNATFDSAEEPFEAAGHKFNRGSFIVRKVAAGDLSKAAAELGVQAYAVASAPEVKTHPARAARIAIMHTWLSTQAEGWWRLEFDRLKIPYEYISTQTASKSADLRGKYDVIVFAPGVRGNPQTIVSGMPMYGNPLPWKVTQLTPNLGKTDETDDMRPGLGWTGVEHLQEFVNKGGLLITANDTTNFAVAFGFAPGVSIGDHHTLEGDGLGATFQDGGRGQPDRLRLPRQPGDLRVEPAGFRTDECNRRRRRAARRRRGTRTSDGPRHGRRPGSSAGAPAGGDPRRSARGSLGGDAAHQRTVSQPGQRDSPGGAPARGAALRECSRIAGIRAAGRRRGVGAARGGDRFALRARPRGAVLQQPDVARGDQGQLFPGIQRDSELRQSGCRKKTGGEVESFRYRGLFCTAHGARIEAS